MSSIFLSHSSTDELEAVALMQWLIDGCGAERAGFALPGLGKCLAGDNLDREIGGLKNVKGPIGAKKLFTYLRYNAQLTSEGLEALGLSHIQPKDVQVLDSVAHISELQEVGKAAVARSVKPEHFSGFA